MNGPVMLVALGLALTLTGCFSIPEESTTLASSCPTQVTMRFRDTGDAVFLRQALQDEGYGWRVDNEGVAHMTTPVQDVEGTIVAQPGLTGSDLIMAIDGGIDASADNVQRAAQEVARITNETYPDGSLVRWSEAHDTNC